MPFAPVTAFHPTAPYFTIQTEWKPCDVDREITYDTLDPSGEHYTYTQTIQAGWARVWYYLTPVRPAKTSVWTTRVVEDGRLLGSAKFEVDVHAPSALPGSSADKTDS